MDSKTSGQVVVERYKYSMQMSKVGMVNKQYVKLKGRLGISNISTLSNLGINFFINKVSPFTRSC